MLIMIDCMTLYRLVAIETKCLECSLLCSTVICSFIDRPSGWITTQRAFIVSLFFLRAVSIDIKAGQAAVYADVLWINSRLLDFLTEEEAKQIDRRSKNAAARNLENISF